MVCSFRHPQYCTQRLAVPTDSEWTILTDYLSGEKVAGGKLKEVGTTHWTSPNFGATNSSGFTALPGGLRFDRFNNAFANVGGSGHWWSKTEDGEDNALYRSFSCDDTNVSRGGIGKVFGLSVRCVQD